MAKGGFSRAKLEDMQYLIKKPRAKVRYETLQGVEFPGHKIVKAAIKRNLAMLHQNHMAGFLSCQNGTPKIHRHAGDAKELVHLRQTDADSWLQSRRHLYPEHHLPRLVTIPELNVPKSAIWRQDMCIHILLLPALNSLLLMHMPRIASTIQILIQICWLMKEHTLVSTQSAVR